MKSYREMTTGELSRVLAERLSSEPLAKRVGFKEVGSGGSEYQRKVGSVGGAVKTVLRVSGGSKEGTAFTTDYVPRGGNRDLKRGGSR